jgi:head-tail adaptor
MLPVHYPDILATLKSLNAYNLPHDCAIQSPVRVENSGGNYTESWTTQSTKKCRLAPSDVGASPNEAGQGAKVVSQVRWFVFFEESVPVTVNQRLVVTGLDGTGTWTKTLDILAVMEPRTNRAMTKVLCLETVSG